MKITLVYLVDGVVFRWERSNMSVAGIASSVDYLLFWFRRDMEDAGRSFEPLFSEVPR